MNVFVKIDNIFRLKLLSKKINKMIVFLVYIIGCYKFMFSVKLVVHDEM